MNITLLKLLIPAMGYVPSGLGVLPWMLLIVGTARVARKMDSVVVQIDLNPAITGGGLGRGLPGMVASAVIRGLGMAVAYSASAVSKGSGGAEPHGDHAVGSSGTPPPSSSPSGGGGATSPGGGSGQGGPGRGQSGTHRKSKRAAYAASASAQQSASTETWTTPPSTRKDQPKSGGPNCPPDAKSTRHTPVPPEQRNDGANAGQRFRIDTILVGQVPEGAEAATRMASSQHQSAAHSKQATGVAGTFSYSYRKTGEEAFHITSERQSSQQTTQGRPQRPPIRQNDTPEISTPPDVSAPGKSDYGTGKELDSSYRRDIQPPTDTAGTRRAPSPSRPPVGGTQPPASTARTRRASSSGQPRVGSSQSTVGTAWARRPPGSSQHPGEGTQPMTDMTGAQRVSDPNRPPVGGTQPLVGIAGTRQSSSPSRPPVGDTQPPVGTARTWQPSSPSRPPVGGTQPPAGTAGARQPSGPSRSPMGDTQPLADTVGTQRAVGPSRPPIGGTQASVRAKESRRISGAPKPFTIQTASEETTVKDNSAGTRRIKRPAAPPSGNTSKKRNRKK